MNTSGTPQSKASGASAAIVGRTIAHHPFFRRPLTFAEWVDQNDNPKLAALSSTFFAPHANQEATE